MANAQLPKDSSKILQEMFKVGKDHKDYLKLKKAWIDAVTLETYKETAGWQG